jgi:nucleotide-binding universal stress UspA family protein
MAAATAIRSVVSMERGIFNRIVVGVDRRQGGRDALALAATLQRAAGGEIVAVHVYTYDRTVPLADAEAVEAELHEDLLTNLEGVLRAAAVSARPLVAHDSSPSRALHAAAEHEEADVIVVGSCHRAGADRVLAGDDATATLHGSPCAVAVAPRGYAERPHELRLIGVGYDGSHESQRALDLACRLANRADGYVRATTAVWPSSPVWPTCYPGWPAAQVSRQHRGQEMLERAIADVRDRVTPEVTVGKASRMLASSSRDLDLLIVGSRAYGPLRRVVLGSTSTHLFRDAACPVLAVPRGVRTASVLPRTAVRRRTDARNVPARDPRVPRSRRTT